MIPAGKIPDYQSRTAKRSLGYDFALLGLNARESRAEVIRRAAGSTATRIHEAATEDSERDSMLGDLAASTYRLLDPRRRIKTFERIQLSLFDETDLSRQQLARTPLIPPELVVAEVAEESPDEALQLREAKREIVELLMENSSSRRRVGTITGSLATVLLATVVSIALLLSA